MKRRYLNRGVLLVIEGIDGAGKTTQVRLLERYLRERGYPVASFKEPTDGFWGRKITHMIRGDRKGMSAQEEFELYFRDREEDVRQNILPALRAKKVVILDRYYYSSVAYQGALGLDPRQLKALNERIFPKPDLVFILVISPEESLRRIRDRKERPTVYEEEQYLSKVAEIFQGLEDPAIRFVEGTRSIEEIHQEISGLVSQKLTELST